MESVGARIPLKPESKEPSPKPEAETPKEGSVEDDEPIDEPEDEESDVDLDMEGVIDPDKDAAQPMGDPRYIIYFVQQKIKIFREHELLTAVASLYRDKKMCQAFHW